MTNQLKIYVDENVGYVDADSYGLSLTDGAFAALLTPSPMKSYIVNESRLEHGKRYHTANAKRDARQVVLPCHLRAGSYTDLKAKLAALTALLDQGEVKLKVNYGDGVWEDYTLVYQSCSSFTQAMGCIALLTIKFVEPIPTDGEV